MDLQDAGCRSAWAPAALERPSRVHNLATSGARNAELADHQLPAAHTLRPDLAPVPMGMNDTPRGDFDAIASAGLSPGWSPR